MGFMKKNNNGEMMYKQITTKVEDNDPYWWKTSPLGRTVNYMNNKN